MDGYDVAEEIRQDIRSAITHLSAANVATGGPNNALKHSRTHLEATASIVEKATAKVIELQEAEREAQD